MTVPRTVVMAARWAATAALATATVETGHRVFSGPWADAPGVLAAAGICLIGLATTPSTTRKAPQ